MTTALSSLVAALRATADHDPRAEAPAEAVLWCDAPGDFIPLLPALRRTVPNLLTLGDFDAGRRQGPAIWLRAALGRALAETNWEANTPAILYLPGVGREVLRAAEECPQRLRLLAWFVVGGAAFGHPNARDWTLRGFLAAKHAYGGLGLDVPQDDPTRQALIAAAPKLFELPLSELQGKRLDAAWLHALLVPDLVEDTLSWLGGALTPESDKARFAAFQARARAELKLDPAKVAPATAAARVLRQEKGWDRVWTRFSSGGRGFHENVAALLAPLDPPDPLLADPAVYASANARQEAELRNALAKLADAEPRQARDAVVRLAGEHARRCVGPWAARGQAPLAQAVQYLARLANTPPLPTQDSSKLAEAYAAEGWEADDAAMRALEAVAPRADAGSITTLVADRSAIVAALRAIYAPRLQQGAEALQSLLKNGVPAGQKPWESDAILFIDGLRMDLAHRLAGLLRDAGATVDLSWRWTGFPSVTATCKPLASPAISRLRGGNEADTFEPIAADGKRATKPVLMRELAALGWGTEVTLVPSERCWIEAGHFDKDGHEQQSRMAEGLAGALSAVAAEALNVIRSGRRLRIVTDHGWLLLPVGLPVAKLPAGLTETRWRRCAVVKEGAASSATRLPWTWNPSVTIATAPGAHVFLDGAEYAHGGISPQESVVPELLVAALTGPRRAAIADVEWSGLRVRVRADGGDGLLADLKMGEEGEGASIADRPRHLDAEGRTSLLVPDDLHAGSVAMLELRDTGGQVVATRRVVVGG